MRIHTLCHALMALGLLGTAGCSGGSTSATVSSPSPLPVTVQVDPAQASLAVGTQRTFTAVVQGSPQTAVQWSVVESNGGTVDGSGRYTAPPLPGVFHLKATALADPRVSAEAVLTITGTGPGTLPELGPGADLKGFRPFPADNPWNRDVASDPVDPASDAIIAFIGAGRGLKADFGSGLWEGAPIGIPYTVVDRSQPKVPVTFTAYGDESDPGPMPIPTNAPIEGGSGATGDRHVLVLDRDAQVLYELYNARPNADGSWRADSSAVWDLATNTLRPYGWTSADAAGLPLFPGLARFDEVARGEILHALRFTVPTTRRAYVLPATHWASSNTNPSAPPMGLRVRLKAGVDLSGFPPQAQVVLRALKRYGMILADNGSSWFISGAPDPRWDNDALATLARIKGSDLEVVRMGTVYTTDPSGAAPTITTFTAEPGTLAAGAKATLRWTASGGTRAFITPEVGWVQGAAVVVQPRTTTDYTLTVQGTFGSRTATARVTVTP